MSQITIEHWLDALPEAEQTVLKEVWYDHVEKFNANNTYSPQSDAFSALWNRYTAATTDE